MAKRPPPDPNFIPPLTRNPLPPGRSANQPEDTKAVNVNFQVEARTSVLERKVEGSIKLTKNAGSTTIPLGGVTNVTFLHLKIKDFLNKQPAPVIITLNAVVLDAERSELLTTTTTYGTAITAVKITPPALRDVEVEYIIAGT